MYSYLEVSLWKKEKETKCKIFRAPTDCVQYFTGKAGNVQSYNFAGGQLLQSMKYTNCIRTEAGYCAVQWKESSTTSPDPFEFGVQPPGAAVWANAAAGGAAGTICNQYILIPNLSPDGTTKIPATPGVLARGVPSQEFVHRKNIVRTAGLCYKDVRIFWNEMFQNVSRPYVSWIWHRSHKI